MPRAGLCKAGIMTFPFWFATDFEEDLKTLEKAAMVKRKGASAELI